VSLVVLQHYAHHPHSQKHILHVQKFATYDRTALFRMTSFTKTLSQNEASIYTSPDQAISDINPLMYGGFTE
jgi:hypothetical protein